MLELGGFEGLFQGLRGSETPSAKVVNVIIDRWDAPE
jgi:hypothetical protein